MPDLPGATEPLRRRRLLANLRFRVATIGRPRIIPSRAARPNVSGTWEGTTWPAQRPAIREIPDWSTIRVENNVRLRLQCPPDIAFTTGRLATDVKCHAGHPVRTSATTPKPLAHERADVQDLLARRPHVENTDVIARCRVLLHVNAGGLPPGALVDPLNVLRNCDEMPA